MSIITVIIKEGLPCIVSPADSALHLAVILAVSVTGPTQRDAERHEACGSDLQVSPLFWGLGS